MTPNRAAAQNDFSVRIERGGAPVRGADVVVTFTMLDMEMPAQSYRLAESESPGLYERAAPALVMVGHWGLSFQVQPPRGEAVHGAAPRQGERMRAAVVLVLLAAALACAAAPSARADGDPASDYLLGQKVFFPYDLKVAPAKQRQLSRARRRGEPRRLHASRRARLEQLRPGLDHRLWRKPQIYARFLGEELSSSTRTGCSIVMPNGFGFNRPGQPARSEYAVLSKIRSGRARPASSTRHSPRCRPSRRRRA